MTLILLVNLGNAWGLVFIAKLDVAHTEASAFPLTALDVAAFGLADVDVSVTTLAISDATR